MEQYEAEVHPIPPASDAEVLQHLLEAQSATLLEVVLATGMGSQEQRPENVRLGNTERPLAIHFIGKTVT